MPSDTSGRAGGFSGFGGPVPPLKNLVKDRFYPFPEGREVAGVVDDMIGHFPLPTGGNLGGFPTAKFRLVPAPTGANPLQTEGFGGFDEDDGIALAVDPRLKEEWGVDHDGWGAGSPGAGDDLRARSLDEGVDQGFEAAAFIWVREHDGGDRSSIDSTGLIEDPVPPPLAKGVAHVVALQSGASSGVGVDYHAPQVGEDACDLGLSRTDTPGQTDNDRSVHREASSAVRT